MSAKTKIVVIRLKELIYTAIFVCLGILLLLLLIFMFLPKNEKSRETSQATSYVAGVYSSSIVLNNNAIDVEVVVDENHINSIRLVNLDEATTAMFPLMKPTLESLAEQVYTNQSLEGITYSEDNKYTTMILLEAIEASLEKAAVKE